MKKAHEVLAGAGLLPREMPRNYTHDRAREILDGLDGAGEEGLMGAAEAARALGVRGPLAAAIFVRHHLAGPHEVEVDRVSGGEEGDRFAVLVYPEGEVPVALGASGRAVGPGDRLRCDPGAARYDPA